MTFYEQGSATDVSVKAAAGALLNDVELSALLGVALQTIRNWRQKNVGPRWVRLGQRCIRYEPAAIRAFIAAGDAHKP